MKQHRVWYSPDPKISSPDTIHQVLMFGTLTEIKSLKKTLGLPTIRKLFLDYPKKVYTATALNFIKNFILTINSSIDEQQYLKNTPRNTG